MRRLAPLLLNAAAVIFILLSLATAILWLRSYKTADAWGWSAGKIAHQCGLASGRLRLGKTILGDEGGTWGDSSFIHTTYSAAIDPPSRRFPATLRNLGFAREHHVEGHNSESSMIMIPLWLVFLIFCGVFTTCRWLSTKLLHQQRRRTGLCAACGYDIRATPDRCPECGQAVR